MRHSAAFTLLMAIALGVAAFFLGRSTSTPANAISTEREVLLPAGDATQTLAWMRKELSLDDEEFARFCKLHDAYMAECQRMSIKMDQIRDRLKATLQDRHDFDDVALAALADYERHYDICERAATKHLMEVAASMDAESGRAYLKLMLPRIFPDHNAVMQAAAITPRNPP